MQPSRATRCASASRRRRFAGNTCWRNDTLGAGFRELWIQYASDNVVADNVFVAVADLLLQSDAGNTGNVVDHNLWFADASAGALRVERR